MLTVFSSTSTGIQEPLKDVYWVNRHQLKTKHNTFLCLPLTSLPPPSISKFSFILEGYVLLSSRKIPLWTEEFGFRARTLQTIFFFFKAEYIWETYLCGLESLNGFALVRGHLMPCPLGLSGGGMKQKSSELGWIWKGPLWLQSWKPKGGYQSDFAPLLMWELTPDLHSDTWVSLSSSCSAHKRNHVLWAGMLGKSVIQQKDGLWSRRDQGLSLVFATYCLTSCETLSEYFFFLSLKFSLANGKNNTSQGYWEK